MAPPTPILRSLAWAADTGPMPRLAALLFVVFALLALLVPASAWASPVISEYPLSPDDGKPVGITAGPDDALWFAVPDKNEIRRIIHQGVIATGGVAVSHEPTGIALGFGALWITAPQGKGFISRK